MLAFRYGDRNHNGQGFKNETMLLSHAGNGNFINRIRVSMHKLADRKKANKYVHKQKVESG